MIENRTFNPAYLETRFQTSGRVLDWPAEFIIVSAYATTGESWPQRENEAADQRLATELGERELWFVRLTGYSPTNSHAEQSWAVLIPLDLGCDLGLRYRQDAIYHVKGDMLSVVSCSKSEVLTQIGSFRERLDVDQRIPNYGEEDLDSRKTKSLLDKLLTDSRLYHHGKDYKDLLDFVVRLRNFAPFNAMLLQIQKPGLLFAASAKDWLERFGCRPKEGARPLLILWPFGPVALVYDLMETEGGEVPEDVASCFRATGPMAPARIESFQPLLAEKNIGWCWVDAGDGRAGAIRVTRRATTDKEVTRYCMHVNRNHGPPTQFATVAHELAHLCLGHLGSDPKLHAPSRSHLGHVQKEIEAESVAYLVCGRVGIQCKSQTYLSGYVTSDTSVDRLEVYQIMRAAGQVESLLDLAAH